ncbi:hypothetical protein BGY98DRAFT_483031 [Russula aff. rugulosa BPL654]|nr:hypothetical protein BGY98DRAFT_483031 [Russula aff. rugulosa BPL654]
MERYSFFFLLLFWRLRYSKNYNCSNLYIEGQDVPLFGSSGSWELATQGCVCKCAGAISTTNSRRPEKHMSRFASRCLSVHGRVARRACQRSNCVDINGSYRNMYDKFCAVFLSRSVKASKLY